MAPPLTSGGLARGRLNDGLYEFSLVVGCHPPAVQPSRVSIDERSGSTGIGGDYGEAAGLPFLEGRTADGTWHTTTGTPIPVTDSTRSCTRWHPKRRPVPANTSRHIGEHDGTVECFSWTSWGSFQFICWTRCVNLSRRARS